MADDSIIQKLLRETCARHVECHEEIASTNDYCLELVARKHDLFPAVVLAERQTTGRGRGGNRWWSGPGALTFSLILDETTAGFEVGGDSRTALLTGLAVAETLAEVLPRNRVGLKWPNDVQISGRKICGILVEIPPGRRDLAVIGVGINVNNSLHEAPPELCGTVTSLRDELNREHSRDELLTRFLRNAVQTFETFSTTPDHLSERWSDFCSLAGRTVVAEVGAETVRGFCHGIQPDGALLLKTLDALRTIRSASTVRAIDD